jgi:hypothetical protein
MLSIHHLADVFPPMREEELKALTDDIRLNGLSDPIVLLDGKILDGRNRYRACTDIGIKPITRDWDGGGDPLDYVVSKNLHRRHLNQAQRAMVADKIATLRLGANQHMKEGAQICAPSQEEAAKRMNVSRRSVQNARFVHEHGIPELQAAVESGRVSVSAASEIAKLKKARQQQIVAMGPRSLLRAAKRIRRGRPIALQNPPQPSVHEPDQICDATLRRVTGTSLDTGAQLDALMQLDDDTREGLIKQAEAGEDVSAVRTLAAEANPGTEPPTDHDDDAERQEDMRYLVEALLDGKADDICEAILCYLGVDQTKKIARALDKRLRNLNPDCRACGGTGYAPTQLSTACGMPLWPAKIKCDCSQQKPAIAAT